MIHTNDLIRAAEAHLPEALEWLREMVGINSFTANPDGVNQLGVVTARCFDSLGFRARTVAAAHREHGRHLFLERPPSSGRTGEHAHAQAPLMLLVTHLDTVYPPWEETRHDFHWQPDAEAGRIYGPGTIDNKGGTVLIWLMLRTLEEVAPHLFEDTHWMVAANAVEEVIGADFAEHVRASAPQGARAVLVFEGGPRQGAEYNLVTSRKGRAEYRITCTGKAAHAGSSHAEGINAVVELSRMLPKVAELTDYTQGITLNVASVNGGTVLNRVPHEAVAELEMRGFDPQKMEQVERALFDLAGQTPAGAMIAVECRGRTPSWPGGQGTEELFLCWQAAAEELGLEAVQVPRGGLSDANYLWSLGPTLDALGPAGGNAHCSERSADGGKLPEFIEPASLPVKAALNLLALRRLLER